MTGVDLICTNAIYTVPYYQEELLVVWSASPLNIVSIVEMPTAAVQPLQKTGAGKQLLCGDKRANNVQPLQSAIRYSSGIIL
jgi:hypothetical protein